ncbi:MAG: ABC transporter substrate-binding protein, partial [Oscillospiraceae bacterium]
MKKFIAALLASAMLFSLAACGKDKTEMNIYGIKGPTSVGLVSLMDKQVENYHFKIVGSPEEIVGKIATGEVDIAAVPTNLAATLYKKTNGNIKMLAINTLGVLSILENGNTIKTVEDLKGKTI